MGGVSIPSDAAYWRFRMGTCGSVFDLESLVSCEMEVSGTTQPLMVCQPLASGAWRRIEKARFGQRRTPSTVRANPSSELGGLASKVGTEKQNGGLICSSLLFCIAWRTTENVAGVLSFSSTEA